MAKSGGTQRELSNTEKAALILLSLGKELAAQVMQCLGETEVKRLSRAFMTVSEIGRELQLTVSLEFRKQLKSGDTLILDGRDFAKQVIASAFGEEASAGMLDYVSGSKRDPIAAIMSEVPSKVLNGFIQAEHPQTISFLLTAMNAAQAAGVLASMTEEMQVEVLIRIANLNNVQSDVVDEVREVLRSQLRSSDMQDEEIGGPKCAANILNFVERTNEERLLSEMEEMYPTLAEQIRNLMFTFEDIKGVDDKGIQLVLKEVPRDQLVIALKTASEELQALIFKNVSQRAAQMIRDDLSALGPVKLKDVEKSQQGVVDIVRRLEAEGKLVLGGGVEEELV